MADSGTSEEGFQIEKHNVMSLLVQALQRPPHIGHRFHLAAGSESGTDDSHHIGIG